MSGGELSEDEVADITENRVVTPQGMEASNGPLNPEVYTADGGQMGTWMSNRHKDPRTHQVLGDALNAFMDDEYSDILRTSQMKTSFSLLSLNNTVTNRPLMPLGWIVPDGSNRTLEEILEKKIANGMSPGGGTGAVIVCLPRLESVFETRHYLVDLDTGEVFAYIGQMWRQTGLYSATQPFNTEELAMKIERYGRIMKMELENEAQTPVTPLNLQGTYTPPPLPPMDGPRHLRSTPRCHYNKYP